MPPDATPEPVTYSASASLARFGLSLNLARGCDRRRFHFLVGLNRLRHALRISPNETETILDESGCLILAWGPFKHPGKTSVIGRTQNLPKRVISKFSSSYAIAK